MEIINPSQDAENKFLKQVMNNFYCKNRKEKRFKKTKNQKEIFNINLRELDSLIQKKLKNFSDQMSLEKLILLNFEDMKNLCDFIDKNQLSTKLSSKEKDYFYTLYSRLDKVMFLEDLNINVCPYCNRNFIFNFTKQNSKNATAQLDHFFDKSTYPYLAISLYNLVPSCATCNQRKSNRKEDIFYPYKESFNKSTKFRYKGIKTDLENQKLDFFDEKRVKIELEALRDEESQKVESHKDIFNLAHLYENHKDIVQELLQKRVIYSDSYIDELFGKYQGSVFSSKDELLRLITCGYVNDEDINKRPLSKLIKDISEELGLL